MKSTMQLQENHEFMHAAKRSSTIIAKEIMIRKNCMQTQLFFLFILPF